MGKIERIKLRDFKSFRNAILPFIDGFICVVGPNGSGKSNIVDAILFVLGEGSMKALRAGRVKDLVHHNSRTGTAEVTIELRKGNEKHSITREIDKHGTSIYRLDGKRTTRTEIQEFIASLGIPPEGYNVIMQGDITNFIKMTPVQRRELIDEIAGIYEYEEKKEKALRELEKVEEKIREARILLHERKGYLSELKKERDEAIRYKNYKKKLEIIRANLLKRELERVEKAFNEKLELFTSARAELERLESELRAIDAEIESLHSRMGELSKEIVARGESEQLAIGKKIEATRERIKYLQETYASKDRQRKELETDLKALSKEILELEKEIRDRKKDLDKLERTLQDYRSKVSAREKEIEAFKQSMEEKNLLITSIARKLDEMTSQIKESQEKYFSTLSEINGMRERLAVLRLTLDRLSRESKVSDEEKALKTRIDQMKKEIGSYRRELLGLENEIEKVFNEEKRLNEEYNEISNELDGLKEEYHSIQSRITTIRAITGNEASEAVLKAGKEGELSGIIGKVEDLCEYPENYSLAVQTAAGPRMNYIITRDDKSATEAVKWLKEKKIGRTTFIPLNKVKPVEVDPSVRTLANRKGVIGFAIDLIKFDKALLPAFQYVFGDTLIVENIDVAREIGFGTVRMVTLDGDVIEASGVVTGGYRHGVVTLKELKRKDELKERIEKLEARRDKLLAKLEEVRKKGEEIRKSKNEVELKLKEKETELKALEEKLAEQFALKSKSEEERKRVEREIKELEELIKRKEEESRQTKEDVEKLERERSKLKDKLDSPEAREATKKLDKMQKDLESIRNQATEIEIRYNSLRSEIELLERSRLAELRTRKSSMELEISDLGQELEKIKSEILALEGQLNEMLVREKEISSELAGLIKEREELQKRINELSERKGGITRIVENKRREVSQLELEKARLETRLVDLRTEWEGINKEEFKELEASDQELQRDMEEIRKKMEKLEPVNMRAIELYEKALKDLEDVEKKAEKLEREKQAVLDLIDSIEERKKEVFLKTFEEIKKNFREVYKEFYPEEGAYADIRLENEENPFQGGLIVEARPAGKSIKRIESLSGGEQAVVALTFLFAVQDYKPSPFYVLDEADAPLDKANSERLARLIKERSKVSQFIVITHNASLIHKADQIIGVSMNKKLGSSVVEVNMKEYLVEA